MYVSIVEVCSGSLQIRNSKEGKALKSIIIVNSITRHLTAFVLNPLRKILDTNGKLFLASL